jgi:hypothetical protein
LNVANSRAHHIVGLPELKRLAVDGRAGAGQCVEVLAHNLFKQAMGQPLGILGAQGIAPRCELQRIVEAGQRMSRQARREGDV